MNIPEATIRNATRADATAIAEIYNQSIAVGDATMDESLWTPAHVRSLMQGHSDREGFIVLERAGLVLGWSIYKRYSHRAGYRFAGETATYLLRTETGRGYGTRLKKAVLECCRRAGYHHLVAKVIADNATSIDYNLRLGYEIVGTQREIGFRNGKWIDVIILQLVLNSPAGAQRHPDPEAMTLPLTPNLRALVAAIEVNGTLSVAQARSLLQQSPVTATELSPWSDFEHPAEDGYGRRMIRNGGYYELMVMSWRDGSMSAIHDHGRTAWGAVRLYGDAEHAIFRHRGKTMWTCSRRRLSSGTVLPVSHDLIHQMGNVGQAPYVTLHLYGCDGCDGGITHGARLFDLDEQAIQFTNGGVFFALPETLIISRKHGFDADFPTTMRHQVEMLYRLACAGDRPRVERLIRWLCADETRHRAAAECAGEVHDIDPTSQRYQDSYQQELRAAYRICSALTTAGQLRSERSADVLQALEALARVT